MMYMFTEVSPPRIGFRTFVMNEESLMDKLTHTNLLKTRMEFVSPSSIACNIGVPTSAEPEQWALHVAKGIAHLHKNGVVHGNLSPRVVVEAGGIYRLIDYTALKTTIQDSFYREFSVMDDNLTDVFAFGRMIMNSDIIKNADLKSLAEQCCGIRNLRPCFEEIVRRLEGRRPFDRLQNIPCVTWRR